MRIFAVKQILAVVMVVVSLLTCTYIPAVPASADSLISNFNEIASQPHATFVPNSSGLGGSFYLSYDQRETPLAWVLAVFPGDEFDPQRGTNNDHLFYIFDYGAPPSQLAWNGIDPKDNTPASKTKSYNVYFEISYPNTILSYDGAFIPGQSQVTEILGTPRMWADTTTVGKGTTFYIDYAGVADPPLLVAAWAFGVEDADYNYIFNTSMVNPVSGVGTVGSMPTSVSWNGKTGDGVVFPVGKYDAVVTMAVMTSVGLQATTAHLAIQVLPSGGAITPPVSLPSPTLISTVDPASLLHPVLLIHGLNSYPDMWQDAAHNNDYFALLKSWGYPDNYVSTYHYSGVGVGKNGYNNQGDIPVMAAGMRNAIMQLHNASLARGGDGLVDIVCHSMGGLIARQYLKEFPDDSYLGKVVSIGTPYQGSWLMDANSRLGVLKQPLDSSLEDLLKPYGFNLSVNNLAEIEMTPNSSILNGFNTLRAYQNIQYYTLYGSIKFKYTESIFDLHLHSDTLDFGDGVVLENSASMVSSNQVSTRIPFATTEIHDVPLVLSGFGVTYSLITDFKNVMSEPYFHNNLTRQLEVQISVRKALQQ